ncbi:MAG: putative cytosine-specific methyltransferase [Prokaryotic dsDNA virus sp.]|nr:MAG: putative cytosine-specific methyltransferase [Prokaryotic dsDNA virus sp.]|tara:strand:- start:29637 stop:30806 length:1170 start_codon:yes stop_codon:yes gene_type:complete
MGNYLKHVDLCSGIGGFSLAFEEVGLSKTIMFCDTEKWCRDILAKHWPNVPITEDVKELANDPERNVPDCDILTAGYPCQPFSVAGKQRGTEDDRHIWPYIFRIVAHKRPTWCVFENVYGHVGMGLDEVLHDLESESYATRTFIVPASGIGARHKRDRLWIVAHTDRQSEPTSTKHEQRLSDVAHTDSFNRRPIQEPQGRQEESTIIGQPISNSRGNVAHTDSPRQQQSYKEMERGTSKQPDSSSVQSRENVGNSSGTRLERANNNGKLSDRFQQELTQRSKVVAHAIGSELKGSRKKQIHGQSNVQEQFGRSGENQREQWSAQPELGGMADGIPTRMDGFDGWDTEPKDIPRVVTGITGRATRLKGLGNAIVPQIAMNIGLAIKEQLQ